MSENNNNSGEKGKKDAAKAKLVEMIQNLNDPKYSDILAAAIGKVVDYDAKLKKGGKKYTQAWYDGKLAALKENIENAMTEKNEELKKAKESKKKEAEKEKNQTYKKRLANALGKKTAAKNLVEEYLALAKTRNMNTGETERWLQTKGIKTKKNRNIQKALSAVKKSEAQLKKNLATAMGTKKLGKGVFNAYVQSGMNMKQFAATKKTAKSNKTQKNNSINKMFSNLSSSAQKFYKSHKKELTKIQRIMKDAKEKGANYGQICETVQSYGWAKAKAANELRKLEKIIKTHKLKFTSASYIKACDPSGEFGEAFSGSPVTATINSE